MTSLPLVLTIKGTPASEVKVYRNGVFLDPIGSGGADDYTLVGKIVTPAPGYIEVGDTWKFEYQELVQVVPAPVTTTVKIP